MPTSESKPKEPKTSTATKLPQVALVQEGDYRVVINRGSEQGIREGQRFVLFGIGDEIRDPATEESLGKLEIVRGVGRVIHVQEKIATIESTETMPGKKITRQGASDLWASVYGNPWLRGKKPLDVETETEPPVPVPFENPKVGDFARPV